MPIMTEDVEVFREEMKREMKREMKKEGERERERKRRWACPGCSKHVMFCTTTTPDVINPLYPPKSNPAGNKSVQNI